MITPDINTSKLRPTAVLLYERQIAIIDAMYDLTYFDRAHRALEQASTIDEAKSIRDKSEAARIYARQIGMSLEMQNLCCELKLRAERRMGEILGASPRQRPGQYQRSHDVTVAPALAEMGISKMQSSRWQAIARLPKPGIQYLHRLR